MKCILSGCNNERKSNHGNVKYCDEHNCDSKAYFNNIKIPECKNFAEYEEICNRSVSNLLEE